MRWSSSTANWWNCLAVSLLTLAWLSITFVGTGRAALQASNHEGRIESLPVAEPGRSPLIFLPAIFRSGQQAPLDKTPRVHAPFQTGEVNLGETAIFWFGRVTPSENYADVRVGYNSQYLRVNLQVFDRLLWYQANPAPADINRWDAVTLYLDTGGWGAEQPRLTAFRIDGILNWWEPRTGYHAVYQGDGQGWQAASIPMSTLTDWRGNAPNDEVDDRGWWITFDIPFSSLGLSGPPHGSIWGLALSLHDRDSGTGAPLPDKLWPSQVQLGQPASWGKLFFGLPGYTPPSVSAEGKITIRHQLNGANVMDGMVGGFSTCGEGLEYWTEWGQKNYAGALEVNVQNERDVSDWPCFSKYYLTFPLDSLPSSKAILSATLKLFQNGNAGGGQWGEPANSLVQVMTVVEDWQETLITWNSAPYAFENVSRTWVEPITISQIPAGLPGVLRSWDVSLAVAEAYANRTPLRLVLYSADEAYNTGRYFLSSDSTGFSNIGRPTLEVVWGNP